VIVVLQLGISRAVTGGRRLRSWPVVLVVQTVLVFAFSFGFSNFSGGVMAGFLAASVLLLAPGWAASAAVAAGSAVLYAALPMRELGPRSPRVRSSPCSSARSPPKWD